VPRLSAEQRAARRNGLGTTDVIQILGIAPWEDAGPMAEQAWGHAQEPVILAWYEREIAPVIPVWRTVHHPKHEWLFATLDAYAAGNERRNIEIKHRGPFGLREGWNDADPAGVPQHVRVQAVLGMAVREAPETDVVCSVAGSPPRVWRVGYDAELADRVIEDARRFWTDHIVGQRPPDLDATAATRTYLDAKYPREEDAIVVKASAEIDAIGQERVAHALAELASRNSKSVCDALLLEAIATHSGIENPTQFSKNGCVFSDAWRMTWKTNKNGKRVPRFTVRGKRLTEREE